VQSYHTSSVRCKETRKQIRLGSKDPVPTVEEEGEEVQSSMMDPATRKLLENEGWNLPPLDGIERPSAKVRTIINHILHLNVLEQAQLSDVMRVSTSNC